ncbi:MAG: DUF2202 domain-containing protein [Candidatus Nanohaloarchaeota archaeon]|nr:DUF2202 domain-containing protein [Candidatus Nanohaloarchaeota archaeon]
MSAIMLFVISIMSQAYAFGAIQTDTDWNVDFNQRGIYGSTHDGEVFREQILSAPAEELSEEEKESLIYMREEEKLARDVYLYLYEKWNLPIFNNIARSEQTHTDMIKMLLDKYGIEDPVVNDERGVFTNEHLQELYNQLIEQGSQSVIDALKVGATVEDVDIKDLEDALEYVDNEDIRQVYDNLMRGSRNHLRAFVGMLVAEGGEYEPQFISMEEYESIISTPMERYGNASAVMMRRGNGSVAGTGVGYGVNNGTHMGMGTPQGKGANAGNAGMGARPQPKLSQEEVKARIKMVLGHECQSCQVQLKYKKVNGVEKPVYEVKEEKEAKLFGLFRVKAEVKAEIDAENGEVLEVKKPWWSFLAVGI